MSITGGVGVGKPWITGDIKFNVDEKKVKSFSDSNCDMAKFDSKTHVLELKFNALVGTSKHNSAKVNLKTGQLFDGNGKPVKDTMGNQVIISLEDIDKVLIPVGKKEGIIPKDYMRPSVSVHKHGPVDVLDQNILEMNICSMLSKDVAYEFLSMMQSAGLLDGNYEFTDKFSDESYTRESFTNDMLQQGFVNVLEEHLGKDIDSAQETLTGLIDIVFDTYNDSIPD